MKKLIMSMMLLMVFMFGLSAIQIETKASEVTPMKTLTATKNHILANVNEVIDTTQIKVQGAFGEIFLNQATLSATHGDVLIGSQSITISSKGVFPIGFIYQSSQMMVYIVTKEAHEDEYVIFDATFDGVPNGPLPQGFNIFNAIGEPGGSAAISGQRLFLSGDTIVLFPSYLQSFTNYIIEADVQMTQAANVSRWTSIMFRYTKESYFQMAVRQNATAVNGVEFAKKISGGWNVPATASYVEDLEPTKVYAFKIDVNETTVKEYINDQLLINYDNAFEYTHGRIGVQTNKSDTYFDNIKITLPKTYIEVDRYAYAPIVDVYQPATGIVSPATTVVWIDQLSQLSNLVGDVRPATAIFRVGTDLNILNADNDIMMSLEEALKNIDGKVMPAFYTNDVDVAIQLADTLRQFRIFDVFIVSKESEVIKSARSTYALLRGVLYYDSFEDESMDLNTLMDVRRKTNTAQALAVILPIEHFNQERVHALQKRAMTVWVSAGNDAVSQHKAILSGANGIVTQNYQGIFDIYEQFMQTTHVRRPLLIAHRGLYNGPFSTAPENTIEVATKAYEKGADIIELDVHLTIDLEVVVIHDNTTIRTAPNYPSITVAQARLDQLKALRLIDSVGGNEEIQIPTLREFMQAFKGKDVMLFIEPKPTQPLLMEFIKDIINELDMYDQSVIITFSSANIHHMNEVMPEMHNGLLTGSMLNAQSVNTSLTNVFSNIVSINASLNPNFGALTLSFIKALTHRGVSVWPWTLNEFQVLAKHYNFGVGGITTDYFSYFDETFNRLVFDQYVYELILNETQDLSIKGSIQTQSGQTYPYMPSLTVVDDGQTGITFNQNGDLLTVTTKGSYYAYTTFSSNLPNGSSMVITSDLFEIHVVSPQQDAPILLIVSLITASTAVAVALVFGIRHYKLRKVSE